MNEQNDTESWSVWRLDDNDNCFMIADNLTKTEALQRVHDFEARGHKQLYWAKPSHKEQQS